MNKKLVLLKDITLLAGTVFDRACNELGGDSCVEAIFALGKDYTGTALINLNGIEDADNSIITEIK